MTQLAEREVMRSRDDDRMPQHHLPPHAEEVVEEVSHTGAQGIAMGAGAASIAGAFAGPEGAVIGAVIGFLVGIAVRFIGHNPDGGASRSRFSA